MYSLELEEFSLATSKSKSSSSMLFTALVLFVVVVEGFGRWCDFLGSNGSTIICSVPLISARQNGHPWLPWPSDPLKKQSNQINAQKISRMKIYIKIQYVLMRDFYSQITNKCFWVNVGTKIIYKGTKMQRQLLALEKGEELL